jgi:hypothetical protein
MSAIAGLVMSFWLGLSPSGGENWRAVYVLNRTRVYLVRCGTRQGAGFLYRSETSVVTSLGVAGCGRDVWVFRSPTDKGVKGKLKAYSSKHDLALLEMEKPLQGPPLLPSSDPLISIGQKVALIGHPYNPTGPIQDRLKAPLSWSLNVGVLGRVSKDYLQVQIHRVAGYAGAPILDKRGRVLGMLTRFGPAGNPIGMSVRLDQIDALFKRPYPKEGWPFLAFELHLHARFSLALGKAENTSISPSNQELRLDLLFHDQWDLGIFIGFDLLGLRSDLDLSLLGGLSGGYRFIMPRWSRPYLNYISLEVGTLFMLLQLATSGKDVTGGPTVDNLKFESYFRMSFWLGLRFYSVAGQFSIGLFFDLNNIVKFATPPEAGKEATPLTPVLSISWGL